MKKVRVVVSHAATYVDALKTKKGGRRDDERPVWIWCTNAEGKSGWVPQSYLRIEGMRATLLCDYDASELTVTPGEILTVGTEESGWLLCVNAAGQRGWIPARNVVEFIAQ